MPAIDCHRRWSPSRARPRRGGPTGASGGSIGRGGPTGGSGWADVWYRGHFGWEYKGPGRDLDKAYDQLLRYKDNLENPPLLVVSDLDRIVIRTNFTNSTQETCEIDIAGFATRESIDTLRRV